MPVPPFQEFMLPLMRYVADSGTARTDDYYSAMAQQFALTEEDKQQLLSSGPTPVYKNRIGWAITHLVKAGLLERPARGTVQITKRGREVLDGDPQRIDLKLLDRFEDHRTFCARNNDPKPNEEDKATPVADTDLDPDEQLLISYRQLRRSLADDLLTLIKSSPPAFFEQLVVDLLVRMGYGARTRTPGRRSGAAGTVGSTASSRKTGSASTSSTSRPSAGRT
jgi:restriction system protein